MIHRFAACCVAVTVALVATACTSPPPRDLTVPTGGVLQRDSAERRVHEAVVRLRSISCGIALGSGFAITPTEIVTNRHVADDANAIQVSTWDGHSLDARTAGVSHYEDLSIISVAEPLPAAATLSYREVSPGQSVRVVGFPEGGAYQEAAGRVIDVVSGSRFGEAGDVIRVDATVEHGNSGGPLLDEAGRVVGVVYAIETATNYGLAIPVSALRRVLDHETLDPVTAQC